VQGGIVEQLCGKLGQFARLRDATEKQRDKLREYRTALISAAVTGQIDIRTYRKEPEAVLETT
jgi:type I restriction enzyme S subunit